VYDENLGNSTGVPRPALTWGQAKGTRKKKTVTQIVGEPKKEIVGEGEVLKREIRSKNNVENVGDLEKLARD